MNVYKRLYNLPHARNVIQVRVKFAMMDWNTFLIYRTRYVVRIQRFTVFKRGTVLMSRNKILLIYWFTGHERKLTANMPLGE